MAICDDVRRQKTYLKKIIVIAKTGCTLGGSSVVCTSCAYIARIVSAVKMHYNASYAFRHH